MNSQQGVTSEKLMTVALKYVKRFIGAMLLLLGLISWLALRTPAMPPAVETKQGQADGHVNLISRGSGYNFYLAFKEVVLKLRIAHLGLRNAGLRSAVNSPSQSQSATILKVSPEISANDAGQNPRTVMAAWL